MIHHGIGTVAISYANGVTEYPLAQEEERNQRLTFVFLGEVWFDEYLLSHLDHPHEGEKLVGLSPHAQSIQDAF